MMFNYKNYLAQFLADYQGGRFYNNSVLTVTGAINPPYFKIIGIHKLTPEENAGKHNLFISVVDSLGKPLNSNRIQWGWAGQKPSEIVQPLALDKPSTEPAGNLVIWAGQVIWAQVLDRYSDMVGNVTTGLPDEAPGNTWGHHSYYVVWMLDDNAPTPPPDPPPCDEIARMYAELLRSHTDLLSVVDKIKMLLRDY